MKFKKGKCKVLNLSRNNSYASAQTGEQLAGEQLSTEGPGRPDRYRAEPAVHSLHQGRPMVTWAALGWASPAGKETDYTFLPSTGEITSGVVCTVRGFPATETKTYWSKSSREMWRWLRDRSIWYMEGGWKSWDCSLVRKESSGRILSICINICTYLQRGKEHRSPMKGQEEMKYRKFCFTGRVAKPWKMSPRDVMETPSSDIHKIGLDLVLSNLL